MTSKVVPSSDDVWTDSGRLVSPIKKEEASTYNIFLLGIAIVIGGQLVSWNSGLQGGFYTFLVSTLFIASGYVCLSLCLAEMTSILPFGGGSYAFARVTLGPYLGYLIGCCEAIESILYVPASLLMFGPLLSALFATSPTLEPIWWLLFYVTANFFHITGGKVLWNFVSLIGFVSLLLIVLYCLATPAFLSYQQNVTELDSQLEPSVANHHSPSQFLQHVHLAAWFFIGVEFLPLSCPEAKNPKVTVPRAILLTVAVLTVTALGILFCTSAMSPGVASLASESLPLSSGYSRAFHISKRAASLLALPGIYATAFGFMFMYGRQMSSMAKSGLFPKSLSLSFGPSQTPYVALLSGSAIGYTILVVLYFTYRNFLNSLFNICILGSFFVYLQSFVSFIIFRRKFSRLERHFTNPLGIASAVYGMFVFIIAFIGVAAFQNDGQQTLIIFIVMLALCSLYYYFVAMKRQFFSPEEQSIMFVTYVIASNTHKKGNKRRKPHAANVTGSGDGQSAFSKQSKSRHSESSGCKTPTKEETLSHQVSGLSVVPLISEKAQGACGENGDCFDEVLSVAEANVTAGATVPARSRLDGLQAIVEAEDETNDFEAFSSSQSSKMTLSTKIRVEGMFTIVQNESEEEKKV